MSVSVVTIYDRAPEQDYYCLNEFHNSLLEFGRYPITIGFGLPWGGLCSKPKYLKAWLESTSRKADYLIVTDAWDVMFQQSPDEIVDKFKAFNCDFVAGAEENCFPEAGMACDFPHTESRYKYLNSGFIVSTPLAMLEVLRSMDPDSIRDDYTRANGSRHEPNDQYYYQLEFCKQPVNMKLDYNCELVMNLCNAEESHLDLSEPIKNTITGSTPGAFHFNGPAKTNGLMHCAACISQGWKSQVELLSENEIFQPAPDGHIHLSYDRRYGCEAGHTFRGPELQMCALCGDAWHGKMRDH